MALVFMDSFDHYATGDFAQKWSSVTGSPAINTSNGRRSGGCARITASTAQILTKTLTAQQVWIVGVAFRTSALPSTARKIVMLEDAANAQMELKLNLDGTISIDRNGTTLGTTSFALSTNVYYYLEWKTTIHNTTGASQLKIDGDSKLNLTNVNTRATSNNTANQVRIGSSGNMGTSPNLDFDDCYICDGSGGAPSNDFLGDCRVDALLPNGEGADLDWTPTPAGTHYTTVDESTPNSTDYVESNTLNHRDLWDFANLTALTNPTLFGVQVLASAIKTGAGARGIGLSCKSGSTTSDGSDQALAGSYLYYARILETDPNTAAAWTESGVNAAQFGVKVTS